MKNILSLSVLAGLATAYSGDLTYYSAGLGSCGITSTGSDAVVALSRPMVYILSDQGFPDLGPVLEFQDMGREQQTALNTSSIYPISRAFALKMES